MNDGELWSFLRMVLSRGMAIQVDYTAGVYPSYEHLSARLDVAARELAAEFQERDSTRAAVQPSASPAGGVPGFKITLTCAHLDEHGVNDPCWTAMVDRFPHVRGYADGPVEAVRLAAEAAAELWFNDEHRPADQTREGR